MPYMAIALVVLALGSLDLMYALSPEYSTRRRVLRVVFWVLYPILLLTFFSGRAARQDKGTHIMYATLIIGIGLFILAAVLIYD
jgi:hypothetical protein